MSRKSTTHYPGCEQDHHDCALAALSAMRAERDKVVAREAILSDAARDVLKYVYASNECVASTDMAWSEVEILERKANRIRARDKAIHKLRDVLSQSTES